MLTYIKIFTVWMHSTTLAIQTEAIRLVSGPLLKISSGTLVNSFYKRVLDNGHLGIVGNRAPHAHLWEWEGLGGPKKAPKGKPFKIIKRGALGARSQKGVIYRNYIKPSGRYARPVAFLWTATKNEMTGTRGRKKFVKLGYDVAYAIVLRYTSMLQRRGVNFTIT